MIRIKAVRSVRGRPTAFSHLLYTQGEAFRAFWAAGVSGVNVTSQGEGNACVLCLAPSPTSRTLLAAYAVAKPSWGLPVWPRPVIVPLRRLVGMDAWEFNASIGLTKRSPTNGTGTATRAIVKPSSCIHARVANDPIGPLTTRW